MFKKHIIHKLIILILFFTYPSCNKEEPVLKVKEDQIKNAAMNASNYLTKQILHDGRFVYRRNLDRKITYRGSYNILRHSGAIYALSNYALTVKDEKLNKLLLKTGDFLKSQIRSIEGRKNIRAVFSDPKINGLNKPLEAKLGGTGLGLVALLMIEKIKPGFTKKSDLRKLGEFILYMQKPDGSFYSKYIPTKGGRNDEWTSLYYPGEAALGLLMLYEKDPDQRWLASSEKAISCLAKKRAESKNYNEVDHWALLATEKLIPLYERIKKPSISKEDIVNHALKISKLIVKKQVKSKSSDIYGAYLKDGRTTPSSTRLEGLLATIKFIPPQKKRDAKLIRNSIHRGMKFIVDSQIKSGKFIGAMPCYAFTKENNPKYSDVRIDYVQHALSAMLQYRELTVDDR